MHALTLEFLAQQSTQASAREGEKSKFFCPYLRGRARWDPIRNRKRVCRKGQNQRGLGAVRRWPHAIELTWSRVDGRRQPVPETRTAIDSNTRYNHCLFENRCHATPEEHRELRQPSPTSNTKAAFVASLTVRGCAGTVTTCFPSATRPPAREAASGAAVPRNSMASEVPARRTRAEKANVVRGQPDGLRQIKALKQKLTPRPSSLPISRRAFPALAR
jgi:hypothetical protein